MDTIKTTNTTDNIEKQIDTIIENSINNINNINNIESENNIIPIILEKSILTEQLDMDKSDNSEHIVNTACDDNQLQNLVDDKNIEVFNIALHQYLTIEEEIKALLIAIKDRNKKKRQLGESLSTYLQAKQVTTVKLGGSYKGKKLENTLSEKKTGFTKTSVTEAIYNELKEDEEVFAKVMESICRKTVLKEIWKIKIVNEKQGISKLDKAKDKIDIAEELLNEDND